MRRPIPWSVVLTLLLQFIAIVIWATQLDARVNNMEQQNVSTGALNEKFARLDERLDNLRDDFGGMKRQLDRLTEQLLRR